MQVVYIASSATALNRHPELLDVDSLKHAHALLIHDLSPELERAPTQMLNELSTLTGAAGQARACGVSWRH